MIEHRDENGELTAIETETPKPIDIPPPQLRYVSPCIDVRFVDEQQYSELNVVVKHGDMER